MVNEVIFYTAISVITVLSLISLTFSLAAIAAIVGFKNSTHTIEWKPMDVKPVEEDPFTETNLADLENPLKRKIKNPYPAEEVKVDEPFMDMDDPNETANVPF